MHNKVINYYLFQLQIDALLISYTRHPDTIRMIKKYVTSKNARRPLILSGISCEEGLENIDDIIKVQRTKQISLFL